MWIDYRYHHMQRVRSYLSMLAFPMQWVVAKPFQLGFSFKDQFKLHQHLVKENQALQEEHLLLKSRLQKLLALEAENNHLRTLLHSAPKLGEKMLVADILQVDCDRFRQQLLLNKGSREGVYVGQPVIDMDGIMGEVIEVNPYVSRVILVTDIQHGIPVQNVRNGIRAIAHGMGSLERLELRHIPNTVDIKEGDTLVTSGLGGRYPAGYPVGTIQRVIQDPSEAFASIWVTPTAHLNSSWQVLLIRPEEEDLNKEDATHAKEQ